jgi:hypothetical protein
MPGQEHRIVAGIDGPPSSLSALRWAIGQAGLTGAAVDAVIAWHYPASEGGYGWAPTGTGTAFDFQENADSDRTDELRSPPTAGPPGARAADAAGALGFPDMPRLELDQPPPGGRTAGHATSATVHSGHDWCIALPPLIRSGRIQPCRRGPEGRCPRTSRSPCRTMGYLPAFYNMLCRHGSGIR